jgi:broad specificity phosphatase PhoE
MSERPALALPHGLEASLARSEASPRRVLLVRHSDRPASVPGVSDTDFGLTEVGEARARLLGRRLGDGPRWALSSPLRRCRRTAELAGLVAEDSTLLGAPGPFVVDCRKGQEVFEAHGTPAVVRAQIRGETWECMRALAEGAAAVIRELLARLDARPGTGIAVSHDACVMPIIAWITGETFADRWLDPLDGAILTPNELFWEGRSFEVPR